MNSSFAVGLQVRIDSVRLPRKALLPLAGKSVMVHAMEALRLLGAEHNYILTDAASADLLGPVAVDCGFSVLIGPGEDVLRRYAALAEESGSETIIRATGDNPAVSPAMARAAVELRQEFGADLAAFDNLPLGTGVEVLASEAILRADREAGAADEREHVTLHLYRNRDRYLIDRRPAPPEASMPDSRVTLDTVEDYRFISELYHRAYDGTPQEVWQVIEAVKALSDGVACGG